MSGPSDSGARGRGASAPLPVGAASGRPSLREPQFDAGLVGEPELVVVLASKSPARLKTLRNAGVNPIVIVSEVDERALVAQTEAEHGPLTPAEQALLLAKAKSEKVAAEMGDAPAVIIGCDSVFEFQGKPYGRPPDTETAIQRIKAMSGNQGTLHTGHWVTTLSGEAGGIGSSIVHFGTIDDEEIEAYVATGEPLNVAGSFTVDGLGGPFVESIEGDYHNVVGISLPLLRNLLAKLGINWRDVRHPMSV